MAPEWHLLNRPEAVHGWNKENASKVRPGTDILLILYLSFSRARTKRLPDFVKQERKNFVFEKMERKPVF
jgi:hypothetical protein